MRGPVHGTAGAVGRGHRWLGRRICCYYSTMSPRAALEAKWAPKLNDKQLTRNDSALENSPKYFALSMFPYPSGALHIGHLRVYTISDTLARYRRMKGYNVVHAMGFDAFGLPAENAAIERGVDAAEWTEQNIKKMHNQMDLMFADFDWDREVITSNPDYYKWTQKLFLMLHEAGLAYRKEALVNWDPVEKSVLANEQVDENGRAWRSGAQVEHKMLDQWFLGITKLAPELLKDLEHLPDWPARVKTMQKNWIGQSNGTNIIFSLNVVDERLKTSFNSVEAFTTRPDTLFGVQYLALALNHPLVRELAEHDTELSEFISRAKELPDDTKLGYRLKGVTAANPMTPQLFTTPVFVAPYVIGDYGHGAVMGVPGHDTRDFGFWKENMPGENIKVVVDPPEGEELEGEIYTGKNGTLNWHSGQYVGMNSKVGGDQITLSLQRQGQGSPASQWRLRDWLISRQRFWGAPIPMIHCHNGCGIVPVPDEDLPVVLPTNLNKPLSQSPEFYETTCPKCHGPAKRDTDTMDTFMDSSWYFFRYTDAKNDSKIFDYNAASSLMPVDVYIGGVEHAILHLLYARFISKFLAQANAWSGGDLNGEPIRKLVTQGMVHGKTFIEQETGRFLKPEEVDSSNPAEPKLAATGEPVKVSFEKMSKSKYNGADPVECINRHGADATRAHILFQAPVWDALNWDEGKIVGIERWLGRIDGVTKDICQKVTESTPQASVGYDLVKSEADVKLWDEVQAKVQSITAALHDNLTLNTLISDYMKLTRTIIDAAKDDNVSTAVLALALERLVVMVSPVVPATAEESWEALQAKRGKEWASVFRSSWPEVETKPERLTQQSSTAEYSVIINGRRRFAINAATESTQDQLVELVKAHSESSKWLNGSITRVTIPKGKRLISINCK